MATINSAARRIREGLEVARDLPGLSRPGRRRLLVAGLVLPFTSYFKAHWSFNAEVRLPDGSVSDFSVQHPSDLVVLGEVFAHDQYGEPPLDNPKLIIDAGAHIGASVSYFATKYPQCRVIGLEASRQTFGRLQRHTARLPNVEIFNVALGGQEGTATFYERAASWGSSLMPHSNGVAIDVEMLTLDGVLRRIGANYVDLLKLDVEGAEYSILRASPPTPDRIGALVGELHCWMPDANFTSADFLALLSDYDVIEDESGADHVFRATARRR